ncbi:hypothetical protein [Paenarthrobacter sp.]|uniref:hypothetical protein n=1 Tax=Paenarthrobacter sp. TaxID=1931993 RepID=UPI002810A8AD|nr:hypothetical protein [Paenarthrobacter sp.]
MTEPERKGFVGLPLQEQLQLKGLRKALTSAGIPDEDLWLRYFSIGGTVGEYEVDAYLQSLHSLPVLQRDLLAHAANELIDELPARPHAPYDEQVSLSRPLLPGEGREQRP